MEFAAAVGGVELRVRVSTSFLALAILAALYWQRATEWERQEIIITAYQIRQEGEALVDLLKRELAKYFSSNPTVVGWITVVAGALWRWR